MQDKEVGQALWRGLLLAAVCGVASWEVAHLLLHGLAHYDTNLTFAPVKLAVRCVILAGGAITGTLIWVVVGKRVGLSDWHKA
jgi:hypothetical protein